MQRASFFMLSILLLAGMALSTLNVHRALAISPIEAYDTFRFGDIVATGGDGIVDWYLPNGSLNHVITSLDGKHPAEMAFDPTGKLYVADPIFDNIDAPTVKVFHNNGTFAGTFGSGYASPFSVVFDDTGNIYVGDSGELSRILKFDTAGNLLDSYAVAGSFLISMDLAADQCVMYYSVSDPFVNRYDMCSRTELTPIAVSDTILTVRLLPNGDLLTASFDNIFLSNTSGGLIKTYDLGCHYGMSIDPEGTSFWAFAYGDSVHHKVDIETGAILENLTIAHMPEGHVGCDISYGHIAVFGELRAATPMYGLDLFEGSSPSDLVIELNQEVTSEAETSNLELASATFRWINPLGDAVRTEIVSLSLEGLKAIASDNFMPNEVGRWTVETDFGNGQVVQKTLDISFNVIPESPVGIVLLIGSSVAVLGAYLKFRR
jgi:hypothetical protein